MASEPVKPYFTRFLRVLTFCLGASKIVIFCENGVVNGVVKLLKDKEFDRINYKNMMLISQSFFGMQNMMSH